MRGEPHPAVLTWVAAQPRALLYTTHINQAEILYGIAALPEGRRRAALTAAATAMFAEDFADRILPFEALAAGARIATRDTGGFAGCGLTVIDPWTVS